MIKQGQPGCWKVITKGKVFCQRDGTFDGEYITFCKEAILLVKKHTPRGILLYTTLVLFILGSKSVEMNLFGLDD